ADEPAVDPDGPRLDALGKAQRAADVAAIDPRDEAVAEAVGEGHRLLLGLEIHRHRHWPENLLARDGGFRRDLIEDGGNHEIAAVQVLRPSAAEAQARAGSLAG